MNALNQIQIAFANFRNLELAYPEPCQNKLYILARDQLQKGISMLKAEYEELGP